MRPAVRQLILPASVAALAAGALTAGPARPPRRPKPHGAAPLTTATVTQCNRGQAAEERLATFRARLVKVRGTSRMSVKLTLEESVAGARYRTISAPGLGVWRKSRRGVRAFAYRQRVKALAEGSAYRVKVQYRWHRGDGSVLKTSQRRSRACRQTDPLPNLRVQRIGGRAADAPGRSGTASA